MSTRRPSPSVGWNFSTDSLDGRGWAVVALLVAAGYYGAVVASGAYGGLLVGLVVPVAFATEAYARARHPTWDPLVGAGGSRRGSAALPTVLGLLVGTLVTAVGDGGEVTDPAARRTDRVRGAVITVAGIVVGGVLTTLAVAVATAL